MTATAVNQLQAPARGPLGPQVEMDFGVPGGPLAELAAVLSAMNGFFLFNAGVQVFRVGESGVGPELLW